MATERLSMRHTREILRQKLTLGRSHRAIAQSLGLSSGTVGATVLRARAAGLDWPQVEALTDDVLEGRLYGLRAVTGSRGRPWPDCAALHAERRKPGVTLELLHLECLEQHPDGYRYTQFCEIYRRWLGRRGLAMRQVHHAGEKLFVDYAGKKPAIIDPATGKRITVELFVAVLAASNYTYEDRPFALRRRLAPFAIAAVSCAVTLALAELLLRLVPGLTAAVFTVEPRTRPASFGIAHIVIEGKDFRAVHDTDGHGFRNSWPWPERAEVVVVGDSLTFGYGVAASEAWPSVLAAALPGTRVINLGLIGASSPQYLRAYEVFGAPLRPRVVLIGVFAQNDFWDAGLYEQWLRSGAEGNYMEWRDTGRRPARDVAPERPLARRALSAVTHHSSVIQLIRNVWQRFLERPRYYTFPDGSKVRLLPHDFAEKTRGAEADQPEYWLVLDALLGLHRLAREQGAFPLVAFLPSKEEVHLSLLGVPARDPSRDLRHALQEHHVDYVDLVPLFRERTAAGIRLFFEEDGHPNAAGYGLIAEGVLQDLRSRRSVRQLLFADVPALH